MKKAKKLGLQSLALVLMAFVLVAGVAFGMTGAWFQDKSVDNEYQIVMGKPVRFTYNALVMENRGDGAALNAAMPGDKIYAGEDCTLTAPVAVSEMYIFIKLTITDGATGSAGITNDALALPTTGKNTVADSTWVYYVKDTETAANGEILTLWNEDDLLLTVPTSLTNDVALRELNIRLDILAIQKDNVDPAKITNSVLEAAIADSDNEAEGVQANGFANTDALIKTA